MKATIGGRVCVGRDAGTGKFISLKAAKSRKKTAVVERLKVSRLKNGKFARRGP